MRAQVVALVVGTKLYTAWAGGHSFGSKFIRRGAGVGPYVHLPGVHFGTGFLSHSQMAGQNRGLVGEFTTHFRLPILVVGLGCSLAVRFGF